MTNQPSRLNSFDVAVIGSDAVAAPVLDPAIDTALSRQPPEVQEYVRGVVARKERDRPR